MSYEEIIRKRDEGIAKIEAKKNLLELLGKANTVEAIDILIDSDVAGPRLQAFAALLRKNIQRREFFRRVFLYSLLAAAVLLVALLVTKAG